MSVASRHPLPVPSLACSHGYPVLVDPLTGEIDRAAIRKEFRSRWKGPAAWPASRVLAMLFAKARLQRKWALADIERRRTAHARAQAEQAAFEEEAADTAERHGFNTAALRFQRERFSLGSLADTWRAPHMRRLLDRALDIAIERAVGREMQAAE